LKYGFEPEEDRDGEEAHPTVVQGSGVRVQ
jgi:hypothetical protein